MSEIFGRFNYTWRCWVFKAVRFRVEVGEEELYRRLGSFLDVGCTSIHERYRSKIQWLKSCYTSTTSKKNLSHLKNEQEIAEMEGESSSASEIQTRRSSVIDFDWKKCIFCKKIYHGKDKNLINVSTFQFSQTLERTVNLKNDSYLKLHIGDFSKLMANEAVYQKRLPCKLHQNQRKSIPVRERHCFCPVSRTGILNVEGLMTCLFY